MFNIRPLQIAYIVVSHPGCRFNSIWAGNSFLLLITTGCVINHKWYMTQANPTFFSGHGKRSLRTVNEATHVYSNQSGNCGDIHKQVLNQ